MSTETASARKSSYPPLTTKRINQLIPLTLLLMIYGKEIPQLEEDRLLGVCPIPQHLGSSSSRFGVWLSSNTFYCTGICHGTIGGGPIEFVAAMEHCPKAAAVRRLRALLEFRNLILRTGTKLPSQGEAVV